MASIALSVALLLLIAGLSAAQTTAPPNEPATFSVTENALSVVYEARALLRGTVSGDFRITQLSPAANDKVNQVFVLTAIGKDSLTIQADIEASAEAFPCEAEPPPVGPLIVRHAVGLSHSRRNRAVYDRQRDWLFSVDANPAVTLTPNGDGRFRLTVTGREIVLRFRPRFYSRHRGLSYFAPWTYRVWQKPVTGWCSWFAYKTEVDEAKMRHAADVLAAQLKPYGLEYAQMDDGFQQTPIGLPDTWLKANSKFPNGLDNLSRYLAARGLQPGIWTNTSFAAQQDAFANRNLFVLNAQGEPANGRWIGYMMDGANDATLDQLIRPVYRGLRGMGWKYFKVDALRHLRYEGYNSYAEHFRARKVDRVTAFRNVAQAIRQEIGPDNFLLGCWGLRPELVGIIDGCRIGDDGFSYAGLAQYNSFNNVVWRNDPDHIELTDAEAYRSCTATSLTGSLYMLTDKPERYHTKFLEAATRTIPPLFTLPGQVYDVDPSRSMHLARVDAELSGSGPRPFDAGYRTTADLFLLEVNQSYENWAVLGRLGESVKMLTFKDLGLHEGRDYLVFEFWRKKFYGALRNQFTPDKIDPRYNCQVFCFRERLNRPQILATNRHISCGALELRDVTWDGQTLRGRSDLVAGDNYTIYLHEPEGFSLRNFSADGAQIIDKDKDGRARRITLRSANAQTVTWQAEYQ